MQIQGQDSIQVVVRIKPNPSGSFLSYDESNISMGKANFSFDHVFLPNATQYDVYKLTGNKQMDHTLEGYNSCLFVYGQTGSGKTHTMIGNNNGIVQQSLYHLFSRIAKCPESQYSITCSYFQIYNEQLFDLLDTNKQKKLAVREDVKKGVFVENLTQQILESAQRAIVLLNQGVRTRHVGETLMNRQSSRSHAIFSLNVQSKQINNGISTLKKSKIHFVDLAGSQRQKSTAALGQRLKEASNINKSLTTLGMVINCLSGDKSKAHVPFRDSKLTFVLRDSLSGNSKTFLIATIADNQNSLQQTLSTLKFAQRAKLVKLNALINQESLSLNVEVLKTEIRRLKDQLSRVNHELEQQKNKKSSTSCNKLVVNSYSQSMESLNQKINSLVDMIPKLLQKDSLPQTNVQEYIKNNNQMLSQMSESLTKFISLKNQVRMKASLQKLRLDDLTPYKFSVGKLNIRKNINPTDSEENLEIQRLLKDKKQIEERVQALLYEQQTMKKDIDKVFQQKSNEYDNLMQKMGCVENRAFELEEANNNLLLQLEMVKEKLGRSQELLKNSEQQIYSQGKILNEYEHKLNSSGLFIETLSKEMQQLHYSISNSARKHRNEMQDVKQVLQIKQMQLQQLQKRHQIYQLKYEQQKKKQEQQRLVLQQESVNLMKKLEEQMGRNDELEAKNIEIQAKAQQKQLLINRLSEQLSIFEQQLLQTTHNLQLKQHEITKINMQKDNKIIELQDNINNKNKQTHKLSEECNSLNIMLTQTQQSYQKQLQVMKNRLITYQTLQSCHKKQIQELKQHHRAQMLQSDKNKNSLVEENNKLKERCNELVVENYRLKSTRPLEQIDSSQMNSKLDYYEEKFGLMKIQYVKSVQTVRVLKQRQIMIKQENMKLTKAIQSLQLQLQLGNSHQRSNNPTKNSKGSKVTNTQNNKIPSNDKQKLRQKQNEDYGRKSRKIFGSLDFVKQLILKYQSEIQQSTPSSQVFVKSTDDIEQLLKFLQSTINKKQTRIKKEIQKQAKLKSQNHLILKQNLYLKQKIRNMENPSYLTITPTKKLKLN